MITADTISHLLAWRHSDDVFVPECKDGPTQMGTHFRLDAWACKKSWVRPCTYGYEIKVTRSDFIRDTKWRKYLDYCNEFYFVAPPGIIDPSELPLEAGLLVCSVNGKRLFIKKKAPTRDITVPHDLLYYILYSRVKVCRGYEHDNREYWRSWLELKSEDRDLGRVVGKKIGQKVREQIHNVQLENKRLSEENNSLAPIRAILEEMGIKNTRWLSQHDVRRRVDEMRRIFSKELINALTRLNRDLPDVIKEIESCTTEISGSQAGCSTLQKG